jgi:putative ABC transport system permease protein
VKWREETHGVQFELVRHFLRRMFDGEWSSSPGQWRSAAIGVFSLFLPAGLLLVREGTPDANYSSKYRLLELAGATEGFRAAVLADEIALLTLVIAVTGLIALLEWQSLFPSGRDYLALASLPVRSRQIFTARFTSVLLFSAGVIGALNLLPSLIAPMEFGSRWQMDSSFWVHAGAQAAASCLACFFVFFAILALQGVLLNVLPAREFARVSVYVQGALAGLFLLAGFYSWSMKEWTPATIAGLPEVGGWLPPVWFAGLQQTLIGEGGGFYAGMAQRAQLAAGVAVTLAILTYYISYRRYRRLLLEAPVQLTTNRVWEWGLIRLLARSPRREGIMSFMAKTLARSRTHRLLWFVYIGAAAAVMLNSSIIDGAYLTRNKGWGKALQFLVGFWPLACSVVILPGFRHVLSIPAELRANWIFQITESQGRAEWMSAVERFVMAYAVAPIYLTLFPVSVYVFGWATATRMTAMQLVVSLIMFEVLFQSWQKLPFTCSYIPGQRPLVGQVAAYIGTLCALVPILSVMIAASSRIWFLFPFYFANFCGIYIWVRRMRREGWGEAKLIYEDLPAVVTDLGIKELTYAGTEAQLRRTFAGDAGHADTEDADSGSDARVRGGGEHPADFGGSAAGGGGRAVSGAAPAGTARPAERGVGSVGEQTAGQILPAYGGGAQAPGGRSGALAEDVGGDRADHGAGVGAGQCGASDSTQRRRERRGGAAENRGGRGGGGREGDFDAEARRRGGRGGAAGGKSKPESAEPAEVSGPGSEAQAGGGRVSGEESKKKFDGWRRVFAFWGERAEGAESAEEGLSAAWLRVRAVFRRRQLERDLEDEMAFHLAMREEKLQDADAARRQFGNVTSVMESCRELWTFVWLETWWQDLRYGLRQLLAARGFTAVAAVTLGLGIGATTAIYSMLDAMLWKPMVLPHEERLAAVLQAIPGNPHFWSPASPADIDDVRQNSTALDSLASWQSTMANAIDSGGEALRVESTRVTANFFDVLGVQPALGRAFRAGEDQPGREREVVLGDSMWRRHFGGDPALVGRSIRLDDQNYMVIGIMPPKFSFPTPWRELWVPLALTPEKRNSRTTLLVDSMGRLKPGCTLPQFAAELAGMAARLEKEHPDSNAKRRFMAWTAQRYIAGGDYVAIYSAMLLGSAFFVLLIACVNVANLQFARGVGRWREVAVRTALGAGRQRLLRQLLTESMVLAAAGGALGLLLARWGLDFIRAGVPAELERYMPGLAGLGLNRQVLEFTLTATLLSGILAGLLPAWRSSRPNLMEALKDGGVSFGGGRGRHRLRAVLMGGEIALAMVLLAGAGLMVRGFQTLVGGSPSVRPASMLTLHLALTENKYREDRQVAGFYGEVLARLAALPGVRSAVAVTALPYSRHWSMLPVRIEGRPVEPGKSASAQVQSVSADYFAALFIPLRAGRLPGASDTADRPRVAVVSERMARRWWPAGGSPIGRRVQVGDKGPRPWVTIVGVVGDIEHSVIDRDLSPAVYLPLAQAPEREMDIGIRTAADAGSLAPAVRAAIRGVDAEQPVTNLNTMTALIQQEAFVFVYMAALMGIFGLLALALSAVGVYGVTASAISSRTHEIGIRMALGATRGKVLGMLFSSGMTTACVGLAVGLIPAYGLARLMRAVVFGVSAVGPGVFVGIPLALAGAAALAIYVPARRAVQADPMTALRNE